MTQLRDYPVGTKVKIDRRIFRRTATGSFWREEHQVLGNCVPRPTCSLETLELLQGCKHVVIEQPN